MRYISGQSLNLHDLCGSWFFVRTLVKNEQRLDKIEGYCYTLLFFIELTLDFFTFYNPENYSVAVLY